MSYIKARERLEETLKKIDPTQIAAEESVLLWNITAALLQLTDALEQDMREIRQSLSKLSRRSQR